jgi:hypothetical protein
MYPRTDVAATASPVVLLVVAEYTTPACAEAVSNRTKARRRFMFVVNPGTEVVTRMTGRF